MKEDKIKYRLPMHPFVSFVCCSTREVPCVSGRQCYLETVLTSEHRRMQRLNFDVPTTQIQTLHRTLALSRQQ